MRVVRGTGNQTQFDWRKHRNPRKRISCTFKAEYDSECMKASPHHKWDMKTNTSLPRHCSAWHLFLQMWTPIKSWAFVCSPSPNRKLRCEWPPTPQLCSMMIVQGYMLNLPLRVESDLPKLSWRCSPHHLPCFQSRCRAQDFRLRMLNQSSYIIYCDE